ncbi:MAG TPA: NADH-quinone oxidoreductase subunit J [Candidatus Acidoferrales bacterium]|jgi:NADH-quinone oxidoreductase subunit J|nr:NADH-quinone oxidoreductase subunit J [Candidatus Acidoferrales bacterium]
MRAWLYLLAAAVAIGIVTTPAIIVFIFGGQNVDDSLLTAFATLLLMAGLAVVSMRDIIRCGLAMIICFIALAGIYVQLGAPLVAAAQVIVYIGAISVLVLFAIMLTQTKSGSSQLTFQTQARWAGVAAAILALLIAVAVFGTDWPDAAARANVATEALARLLFADYVLPFEVVSVLLLAAVIGGVFLAKREDEPGGRVSAEKPH